MKAIFKVTNPDKIEVTMTITGEFDWWKDLRDQMKKDVWPSCQLTDSIRNLIDQVNEVYCQKDE